MKVQAQSKTCPSFIPLQIGQQINTLSKKYNITDRSILADSELLFIFKIEYTFTDTAILKEKNIKALFFNIDSANKISSIILIPNSSTLFFKRLNEDLGEISTTMSFGYPGHGINTYNWNQIQHCKVSYIESTNGILITVDNGKDSGLRFSAD
ncbi:MAG: hypothetical protein JWN76_2876 [Chitinophagaceae bacterium]|nr:hypothetical protein [Chitinophagaceae bacterium]